MDLNNGTLLTCLGVVTSAMKKRIKILSGDLTFEHANLGF